MDTTSVALTTAYRDPKETLLQRRGELLEQRRRELAHVQPMRSIYRRRSARIACGSALGAMFVVMAVRALIDGHAAPRVVTILVASWFVAGFAYLGGLAFGHARVSRWFREELATTDDVAGDVRRFETTSPLESAARRAEALEVRGIAAPMAGVSLMLPLTLHLLVAALFGITRDFDFWISASLLVVGHAHVALAICCVVFARRTQGRHVAASEPNWGWKALLITVAVSALPGVILYAVPPLLVAITGIVFIPKMFAVARGVVALERVRILTATTTDA